MRIDLLKCRHRIHLPLLLFGIGILLFGIGVGYAMYMRPEGRNPEWPLWIALFVPILFAGGGLHLAAGGLGFERCAALTIRILIVCLLLIANWAAFYTVHFRSRMTIYFLGVPLAEKYLDEIAGRNSLRLIIGSVDALVILALCLFAWQNLNTSGTGLRSNSKG